LPNRTLFHDRLKHALLRRQREEGGLAVLFVDLDRFKHINDTLGHPVGDEVLRRVAKAMVAQVRAGDTVARIGGDEFVLLLEDDVSLRSVAMVAQKLVDLVSSPFVIDGKELYVTASIGISLCPNDGDDADSLLKNADMAMYKAKQQGRNNFQFYEAEMGKGAHERLALENALRGAVRRNELFLHYQPQVDLVSGRLAGVEALVRWQHPELGLVSPGRFIPVAEDMGVIQEIGDWVLREACSQVVRWRDRGFFVPRMAVNLSMQQLEKAGLESAVAELLSGYNIPASQLELEVTESVIMNQSGRALETLDGLRRLGVFLAIDDFGTGYSSLSYLRQLPVHRLKIDYSFVRDIGRDPNDEAIALAIISLGHSLGLEVVAEGVERAEQADFLLREGCDVAQGYYFDRPVSPVDLENRWK
jgi:diguanylate cyclase (GGDEF)-like protein